MFFVCSSEVAMKSARPQFDRDKLKEAVWLLASHCDPSELGNVKLHKILYFSDMLHFVEEGRPITGEEYLKQKFGPTARHLTSVVRSLENEGLIEVEEQPYFGFYKKSYRPRAPFERSRLSPAEADFLVRIADMIKDLSARDVSELSHNAAWEAARMGEPLPYFTALQMMPEEVSDDDLAWARETARDHAAARPQ